MDRSEFTTQILAVMPKDTEAFDFSDAWNYRVNYSWLLKNDPRRPHKRSRNIVILMGRELMDDFSALSGDKQQACLERLKAHIKAKLESFEGDHSAAWGEPEPIEEWVVGSADLLS